MLSSEKFTKASLTAIPTRTVVGVAALPNSDALVQMDALISNGEGAKPGLRTELGIKIRIMHLRVLYIDADSGFSHYNNLSAQLPIDVNTGELVSGGITEQTTQCLTNIKTILRVSVMSWMM